jgi:cell division protease FtsH
MASKKETDSKNSDDKNKNNWMWYLFFGAMMIALLTVFLINGSSYSLKYPDFVELVQNTNYVARGSEELADGSTGRITTTPTASLKTTDELSELRSVLIGKEAVRGTAKLLRYRADGSVEGTAQEVNFVVPLSNSEKQADALREMLDASNINWNNEAGEGFLAKYGMLWLPLILFLVIAVVLMRRMGGVGSPMSFGRSRGRLYAQEDIGVLFDDVAGIDEAVEEVREVVDFLKQPDKYQRLGGRIPKGVLLVGPPGTGKTLLAKAIAGEAGVPFFSLSGSDFVEMFVGVGAARVRDMFQQATAKAPCIIFIDELDALGKSRSGNMAGSHDEREQTLNALLVEMDGFDANAGVIVMAATNRPETLDPALLRPGRFDRNVLVDRPDKQGRHDILKVHVKTVKLGENVELKDIASITPGFVGADLANLVNEAALLAARKEKDSVGQEEFNDGVERVTAGLEKKQRIMNEDEKLRVAYHEAGHALVAHSLPNTDPVHKVSIIPRGMAALGYTMQRPEGDRYLMTQLELEAQMQVLLAGTLTEEMVFRDISTGAQNDLERATAVARGMVMEYGMSRLGRVNYRESARSPFLTGGGASDGMIRDYSENTAREIDQEVKRIIDEAISRTRAILSERRTELESLAQRLIEVEVVGAEELETIMGQSIRRPRVVPGTSSEERTETNPSPNASDTKKAN